MFQSIHSELLLKISQDIYCLIMSTRTRPSEQVDRPEADDTMDDCKIELLANISHVVTPQALDITWGSWLTSNGQERSISFMGTRTYTLRAKCNTILRLHAYLIGVYEKHHCGQQLSLADLRIFCRLLNNPRLLGDLSSKHQICSAPFSAATQHHEDNEVHSTINAIGFHCHCKNPFSLECWITAHAASTKILSVARGITAVKCKKNIRE
ncbi:nuclear protein UL55 [Felid alphaherpesvirus 1]|nr:nuclear protein UL55 [Felid alphaherpesvirus 1]